MGNLLVGKSYHGREAKASLWEISPEAGDLPPEKPRKWGIHALVPALLAN
jgi:hypothetical protein